MKRSSVGPARAAIAILALFLALIAVTACGGSSDSSTGSEAATGSETVASEGGEGGEGGTDQASAEAAVNKASGDVKFISPGGPIDVSKLQGKELWIVSADLSIPFHQNIVAGFEEAAEAAGMKPVKFDGKGQTKEAARGIEQAIGAGAGAIALISIDTRFVSGAVEDANTANIPVIGILNTDARAEPDPGTAGEATIDYSGSGELLTAYAVANTDGPVNALYSDTSEFRVMGFLKEGIEQGMEKYCDEECSLDIYDTQIANFKTELPTLTQSQLKVHPDTNWLFPAFDAQSVFVVPAIKQAGKAEEVKVGSINAVQANLDLIKNEDLQVVDVGNPNGWLGWAAADRMMRALDGEPPAISVVPIKLFDKENLESIDTSDEAALFEGADYQAEYQRLWK